MAASAATTDVSKEHNTEATTRRVGGLLAVLGIQSWTIGLELAWGRTPAEVPCIFFVFLIFHIYFLHLFIY